MYCMASDYLVFSTQRQKDIGTLGEGKLKKKSIL